MSPVKSTAISVNEGEEIEFKGGFLSLETETWLVNVCHSEGEWERLDLSAFERGMVLGTRRIGLCVSRTLLLLGFSCSTVSHASQEWSTTKGYPANLTTVGSIGVNIGQHPCGTLSTSRPCSDELRLEWDAINIGEV